MLSSLKKIDQRTAVGILSRAALFIEDRYNPEVAYKFDGEAAIREAVLHEVMQRIGIQSLEVPPELLERLGDILDDESESLIGDPDPEPALENLGREGVLPSDLYQVQIIPNISEFHGDKFPQEEGFIRETVARPDKEQHYGPQSEPGEPVLISLFAKRFVHKFPIRSFTMLVAGQRNGTVLVVHQAWRIYDDMVNLTGINSLVEMLERFSDAFGAEFEFEGRSGHFILNTEVPKGQRDLKIEFKTDHMHKAWRGNQAENKITISHFTLENQQNREKSASLIVAIDLARYGSVLKSRRW